MHAQASSSSSSSAPTRTKQGTPCRYYYRSGACKRGDKCIFSHSITRQGAQVSEPSASATMPARLSAQAAEFEPGSSSCSSLSASAQSFQLTTLPSSHDEDAWQDVDDESQPSTSTPRAPKSEAVKAVMKGVPASVSPNTEPCVICMEVPTVYAQHPNCDHIFCPPCLQQWRRQHGQSKNKNCPTCRTPSDFTFVTPQPFTSGARALALQRFRQRAAETPCKNFTKSLQLSDKRKTKAFCVFGDECLYQHIDGKPHKFGTGRFRIQRDKKGTRRIAGLRSREERAISDDFARRIQDMDERVRMFLSTRVILNARSQMSAA